MAKPKSKPRSKPPSKPRSRAGAYPLAAPPSGAALVRMYRQGLGDCFLLVLAADDGSPFYMLIDCGVWDADPVTVARMKSVVADVRAATGGHLHLLVATHEHWDHLSGFKQAAADFDKFTIDNVWLAWTESPSDPQAQQLRTTYQQRRTRLAAALPRVAAVNSRLAGQIHDLIGLGAAGGGADPAGAMQWLRGLPPDKTTIKFLEPGETRVLPSIAAVKARVLGPPRDELLERPNPTKRNKDDGDVYRFAACGAAADAAFFSAAEHHGKPRASLDPDALDELRRFKPFEDRYEVKSHRRDPFFARHYHKPADKWRTIDAAWMDPAAHVALWMSNCTNNTSLVLALELGPSGKVLLFVGDAQVGNWMSWHDLKLKPDADPFNARDLLARTVLYKVGHHGSHNATLKRLGVDLMTSPELVAMIPVDRDSLARGNKKTWKMPFQPLYTALRDQADGRVLRADDGIPDKPASVKQADWDRFTSNVTVAPLYIQYTVS